MAKEQKESAVSQKIAAETQKLLAEAKRADAETELLLLKIDRLRQGVQT